ncbi:aldo/keto reductase [Hymenobacter wooponensis]|uniref:Aldo/keto reductase n=1 Tax=Hymenobacter wooponensis TaxID=1525360 RepID=A0A4Z0MLS0_9BACT|nr:aldo/keto reductase [Hymenobacter wooponensis]TGD80426.1 aldo/keto reductase [Hymenobacter wooponensis]
MKYNSLGKTAIQISEVGFGCMSLSTDQGSASALLHQALDHGITFFDTADLYQKGENEAVVGKALKGQRAQVVLATKVGNQWRPDGSGWDWNPTKSYILQAVEQSLRRLQTDYLDLYQLHGGTLEDPVDEIIEAFELLVQQGKIRSYGISSIRPNVIREYVSRSRIASVMMQYSLLDRRPEESCLSLLQEHQIGVLARGSLAQGLLVNKPATAYVQHPVEHVTRAPAAIRQVADVTRTPAEVAARFVMAQPAVSAAVLGIRTPEQLQQAIRIADSQNLTSTELNELREAVPAIFYEQHR